MLINEVETKVGLSKKSIRFYEENGLLNPTRNRTNSYRIYDNEDIHKLKVIKFLRELNVSIHELQLLNREELSLEECLEDRLKKIEVEMDNYSQVKKMCEEIVHAHDKFSNIDITKYSKKMTELIKKGFTMKKSRNDHSIKILGACLSSLVFGLMLSIPFLALLSLTIGGLLSGESTLFIVGFSFLTIIFSLPLVGIFTNLIIRIKEIKSGEEDKARIY